MRAPVLIGIIITLHVCAVASIVTMQGCETTAPRQTVEPPPAPVMPPQKETVMAPKPVIQPPVPVEAAPSMIEPSGSKIYVVQKGDSLSRIASRCGVSSREIMELNKIKDANKVMVGQKLVLPDYAHLSGAAVAPKPAPAKEKSAAKPRKEKEVKNLDGAYVVQPGDSLSKIAAKNGTTVKALKETNQLKNDKILVGQKLALPGAKTAAQIEKIEPAAATPAPEAAAPAIAEPIRPTELMVPEPPQPQSAAPAVSSEPASPQNQPLEYTVQEGETLEDIAKIFIVRKEDIVKLNNLSADQPLRVGQKIKIPATSL